MEKVQNLYMLNSNAFLIINSLLHILNLSIGWTRQFTNLPRSTYSVSECMSSPTANLEKMAKRKIPSQAMHWTPVIQLTCNH
jgi:hypothetical protein